MKNKILVIILMIVFIAMLFGISNLLKSQEENKQAENISEKVEEENMSVLEINTSSFEEEVLKSEKPVLVDFYADWCGPCKMLAPTVDEIANENPDVKVCRINIDENEDLAAEYGIMSIPALVVIKNGEEINRTVGVVEKEEILEKLK